MKGFTLIEMLVSVAIFTIVMVMALGALLVLSTADRKAESLKSAINNLNFALDSMSREIRTGYNWGCNTTPGQSSCNAPSPAGNSGANEFVFTSALGQTIYYKYDSSASDCGQTGTIGCIARSTDGSTWSAITAPEVVVAGVSSCSNSNPCLFYLVGANRYNGGSDYTQPKLTVTITGYVLPGQAATTSLQLQTSVTQRLYDQ